MLNLKLLKDGLCPKCSGKLKSDGSFLDPIFYCTMVSMCKFRIYEAEYNSIVAKVLKEPTRSRRMMPEQENAADLNNLGHAAVAEDFSDSPVLNQ